MARTTTAPFASETATKTGAEPRYILQLDLPSGTVYYSTENLTTPVTTSGLIVSMGELQIDAQPGKSGGIGNLSLDLFDGDRTLMDENEAQPGFQNHTAQLWMWYKGTTWPDDRLLLFQGVLTTPMAWDEATAVYRCTMKGLEHQRNPNIGVIASAQVFPDINCKSCENELIPIVYGDPVSRVPACVIDRPGQAQLAETATLLPPVANLVIDRSAGEAGFTVGETIELIVGGAGRWERFTGSFDNSDDTTFTIQTRGAIFAGIGSIVGFLSRAGIDYIHVPRADFPDNADASRMGYAIAFQQQDGTWTGTVISVWDLTPDSVYVSPRGTPPNHINVVSGSPYFVSQSSDFPIWPTGTAVNEAQIAGTSIAGGEWTFVVNFLPSKEIIAVEAPTQIQQNGVTITKWAEFDPAHYSVDLNNKSFNTQLGREVGDPGLTTVTTSFSPANLGFQSEEIYVTLRGITDTNDEDGTPLNDPADIIGNLLVNPFLGGLEVDDLDTAAFGTAMGLIQTKFSFAIVDEKRRLNDLCADLAYQAKSIFYWDGGKATIKFLRDDILLSDSIYTISNSNRKSSQSGGVLTVEEIDGKEHITEMLARFRRTIPSEEARLLRGSEAQREDTSGNASSAGGNAAKTDWGLNRDELDLWAMQFPSSVALTTELWLRHFLSVSRVVTIDLFLDAIALQPGDIVTLSFADGTGTDIFTSVPARVIATRFVPGNVMQNTMPGVQIRAEIQNYDYGLTVLAEADDPCAGQATGTIRTRTRRLHVRSTGRNRSLYVVRPSERFITPTEGDAGVNSEDPGVDIIVDPPHPPPIPGPGPTNSDTSASEQPSSFSLASSGSSASSGSGSSGSGSSGSGSSGSGGTGSTSATTSGGGGSSGTTSSGGTSTSGGGAGSSTSGTDSSSGGDQLVTCCPDLIPNCLFVTTHDGCGCINGNTYEICWTDEVMGVMCWEGPEEDLPTATGRCAIDLKWQLCCNGNSEAAWDLCHDGCSGGAHDKCNQPTSASCDPLRLEFTGPAFIVGGACGATLCFFNATVTE